MALSDDIAADLLGVFLTDFAVTVTASTWGTEIPAIFDKDYVEFNDVSGMSPYLLLRSEDIPETARDGDLFTVEGARYKLVDKQYADPGLMRVVLAVA